MSKLLELFGVSTSSKEPVKWQEVVDKRWCPFLERLCLKGRKSQPNILIGSCSVSYSRKSLPIIICPHRLLERQQLFTDCLHLLTLHEPGNELHIVSEVGIPGGSVDYFVVSASKGKVRDFVGVELQTLDTTGTVWPERQRFLLENGLSAARKDAQSKKTFGMNWMMNAKTILIQLHNKVVTFENINKKLVLVLQDSFMEYMRNTFVFDQVTDARLGDSMHFHAYSFSATERGLWRLELAHRYSTSAAGVAKSLGQKAEAKVNSRRLFRC